MNCLRTLVLGAMVCGLLSQAVVAAAAEPAPAPAAKEDKADKAKPRAGRLPPHYSEVVDAKQRDAIYAVQQQCAEKISQLKAELDSVTKQRDTKIDALLTPEQRQKVADLAAAAKAKREAARAKDVAPKKAPAKVEVDAKKAP